MADPPLARSPSALCELLVDVDAERLRTALAAGDERPIDYRLGTAEAEEVALLAGIKPMVRQFLREEEVERASARLAARGLVVHASRPTFIDPPHAGRVLYAGRDGARVRAAAAADAESGGERALGQLLGYPRCCVERYLETPPPRQSARLLRAAFAATRTRPSPRLNVCDLSAFHYLSWVPCAFDCAPSLSYANQVAFQIAFRHGQLLEAPGGPPSRCPPGCAHQRFVVRIDRALGAHRLLAFEEVQVSISGRFVKDGGADGGWVAVAEAWPSARDRHPAAVPANDDPGAREAAARLCALVAGARRVEARGDTLLLDGEPRLRTPELLLVPFGPVAPWAGR